MPRTYLFIEFIALFFGLPSLLYFRLIPLGRPIPALILMAVAGLIYLKRSQGFDLRSAFSLRGFRAAWPGMAVRFILGGGLLTGLTLILAPEIFLDFVSSRPWLWALVMLLYPLLSVIPQGIIHRGFLFHRYEPLFPDPEIMVLAGASAFCYMHILFRNPIALVLTFIGGLFFGIVYRRTRSILVSSIEHALFGNLIFTLGLGRYLYLGAVQ